MHRLVAIVLLLAASLAGAKTTLDVDPGFGGRFRAGRWSPVFITVQSDKPRDADVELHVANASGSVMSIHQTIGIGTQKQTYVMYAPLSMMDDPARVTLTDREANQELARWPADTTAANPRFGLGGEQIGFMIATSGRSPMMAGFTRTNVSGPTIVTHLQPALLPTTPIGYDSLDLLALNHPDLEALTTDQQIAIVAWVRSGGTLVIWPGPDPLAAGPLESVLPATAGDNGTVTLPANALQDFGLPKRFASIGSRALTPRPSTADLPILGNSLHAAAGKLGLGRIVELPIDASSLQFASADQASTFWNDLLDPLYNVARSQSGNTTNFFSNSDIEASQQALTAIGDIPGTVSFGFSWVLLMIGAMMLLVGPVDYLVLKKLNRQPWTWTTVTGWIGLFTVGALLAGRLFQSGDLHFRTLQLIDQIDGRVIGANEVALVYAPRSATHSVSAEPTSWWQAVPSGNRYVSSGFSLPLDLQQDYRGTVPGSMWIDVWSFRFLQSRTYGDGPGWVETTPHRTSTEMNWKYQITVKNQSPHVMKNLTINCGGSAVTTEQPLAPNQSAVLELTVPKTGPPRSEDGDTAGYANRGLFNIDPARTAAAERPPLPGTAAKSVAHLIAEVDDAVADLALADPHAIQQHRAILRATFDLTP